MSMLTWHYTHWYPYQFIHQHLCRCRFFILYKSDPAIQGQRCSAACTDDIVIVVVLGAHIHICLIYVRRQISRGGIQGTHKQIEDTRNGKSTRHGRKSAFSYCQLYNHWRYGDGTKLEHLIFCYKLFFNVALFHPIRASFPLVLYRFYYMFGLQIFIGY